MAICQLSNRDSFIRDISRITKLTEVFQIFSIYQFCKHIRHSKEYLPFDIKKQDRIKSCGLNQYDLATACWEALNDSGGFFEALMAVVL